MAKRKWTYAEALEWVKKVNAGKEKTGLKYLSACDFLKIRVKVKGNE